MNALGKYILDRIGIYYIFTAFSLVLAWFAYTGGNINPYLITLIFAVIVILFINLESRLISHKWVGCKSTIGTFIGTTALSHFTLLMLSLPNFVMNPWVVVIAMAIIGIILILVQRKVSCK